jgi:hypothetical protein
MRLFAHAVAAIDGGKFKAAPATRTSPKPQSVSRKTFSAPPARHCFTCASTLWPAVDTGE